MSWGDSIHLLSRDSHGRKNWKTYRMPVDTPLPLVDQFKILVQAVQLAHVAALSQEFHRLPETIEDGAEGAFGDWTEELSLRFKDQALTEWDLRFVGPFAALFLPDGSLDETHPDAANLIAFILANLESEDGLPFTQFVSGSHVQEPSAVQTLNGAIDYIRDPALGAEWDADDGFDAEVSP